MNEFKVVIKQGIYPKYYISSSNLKFLHTWDNIIIFKSYLEYITKKDWGWLWDGEAYNGFFCNNLNVDKEIRIIKRDLDSWQFLNKVENKSSEFEVKDLKTFRGYVNEVLECGYFK